MKSLEWAVGCLVLNEPLMTPRLITLLLLLSLATSLCGCRRKASEPWQRQLQANELSESQFTEIVAQAISERLPRCKVKVSGTLEVSVTPSTGSTTCYLGNVWKEIRADPRRRVDVVRKHLEALQSTIEVMTSQTRINRDDIVPMIKDHVWLEESKQQQLAVYRQPLAADLSVVFAIDGEHQLAFLSHEQVRELDLSADAIRDLAVDNLRKKLIEPTRHGEGPLYMMTAGGTFEASLLLFDDVWEHQDAAVDGSLVVAVPSRDLLMFTGTNAPEAIQQMRSQVNEVFSHGSYLISKTLLVREGTTWREFAVSD